MLKVDCCRNPKPATKSTVAVYVQLCCWFWQQIGNNLNLQFVAVDFVADTVEFTPSMYGAKETRSALSTFNKVDRVEFNFVASVYRALVVCVGDSNLNGCKAELGFPGRTTYNGCYKFLCRAYLGLQTILVTAQHTKVGAPQGTVVAQIHG